jgi:hypothetical protein
MTGQTTGRHEVRQAFETSDSPVRQIAGCTLECLSRWMTILASGHPDIQMDGDQNAGTKLEDEVVGRHSSGAACCPTLIDSFMAKPEPTRIPDLSSYLSASRENYDACLDVVEHAERIEGGQAVTRLHHVRFNANGTPMLTELAECLVRHLIDYCISTRHRTGPLTNQEAMRLAQEARRLLAQRPLDADDSDQTGQAGEVLLYFLVEAVLGAPQVVAKSELKTNPQLEVNGSDGIHMRVANDGILDIYFGESKIYQDVGQALSAALKSIELFHDGGLCRHEFSMVTKHFKYADSEAKQAIMDLLDAGKPGGTARVNHALLVGYDWHDYGVSPVDAQARLSDLFRMRYVGDAPRLHQLFAKRLASFKHKHLRLEVFFLPFHNVQAFRDAFREALK